MLVARVAVSLSDGSYDVVRSADDLGEAADLRLDVTYASKGSDLCHDDHL
jgi:hypothetical protein